MSLNAKTQLGILGGGQLGRMLLQAGIDFDLQFNMLDPDEAAPCANIAHHFVQGDLGDYQTVVDFGQKADFITIEIEKVNTEALEELAKQGKKVYPQPHLIRMIQDKRVQKQFYKDHQIPTSEFVLIDGKEELENYKDFLPAVEKVGKDGYDGKGVQVMHTTADFDKAFDAPSLLEKLVPIEKEISIIVARNESGEISTFPAVECVYHPAHNLVDYLLAPAEIPQEVEDRAKEIAVDLVEKMDFVGLLAVEMFWDKEGQVLVNEIAPRPHNSGHQTIEGNYTSQYQQHLRALLNLPLGDTSIRQASAMINLLGEDGHTGPAYYEGIEKVTALKGVHVHLYGKAITKPFRKMGHVTILGDNKDEIVEKMNFVRQHLKVVTQ